MNADTFAILRGGTGRNQIPAQTLASTVETEFQVNTDTSGTTAIALLSVPQQTAILGSSSPHYPEVNAALSANRGGLLGADQAGRPYFNSQSFDLGKPFLVRICGTTVPASNASNTLTITLYSGTSKSATAIATTGAIVVNASVTPFVFILEAQLVWSLASATLNGQFWYLGQGTTTKYNTWAQTTVSTVPDTLAHLQFCATETWGNAVGGVTSVSEFSLSRL